MQRRYVIEACYQISAAAWTRYEHLTDRAQRFLALAFGEGPDACHDDGTPLTAAERRHAQDIADRLRAALPRYLLLAHKAQREVARLHYLDVPAAFPPQNIRFVSSPYLPDDLDDEVEDDAAPDDPYPYAAGSEPARAADALAPDDADADDTDDPDDEDEDEDEDDDLPDDPTDMRAFEAIRDRLEEYVYHLRQQRAERAAAAANAPNAAAAADPSRRTTPPRGDGEGVGGEGSGVGEDPTAPSLTAPERPATPSDALSPHAIGTAGESPLRETENLAETATGCGGASDPQEAERPEAGGPPPTPLSYVPWDLQFQDGSAAAPSQHGSPSSPTRPDDNPSQDA